MRKYIKLVSIFLSVLFLLPIICQAHGSVKKKEFVLPDSFDESKEYNITFWAKNDSNVVQKKVYSDAIESFEALYPNIHIEIRSFTDYNAIYNSVITNISTDTTPNICITYPDHIATYITGSNVVVPLDELMDNSKYGLGGSELKFESIKKEEVISKYLSEGIIGTNTYALPFMRSSEALYINKDLVEKLGYTIPDVLTWDLVWEISEKALEKDENGLYKLNGQNVMIPFIYKSTDNMMISMLEQKKANYSDGYGNILMFNDDTKEIMKTVYEHAKTKAFSTFGFSSYPGNYFNAGQCIFAVDSTAGATWMGSTAPLLDISKENLVQFETVVRPIPQYDTEDTKMISQGPSICIFNKDDPQEVIASWMFAQYLLSNDVQIRYSNTEGYVPVTTKAINSEEYQNYLKNGDPNSNQFYKVKIDCSNLILANIENTFTTKVFNGSVSLRNAAGQLIEETVRAGRKKDDFTDEKIESLFDEMKKLYRLDSVGASSNMKVELGSLPKESIILLSSLAVIWVAIIVSLIIKSIKKKNKKQKS